MLLPHQEIQCSDIGNQTSSFDMATAGRFFFVTHFYQEFISDPARGSSRSKGSLDFSDLLFVAYVFCVLM
jgi:hypothetical protein